MDDLISRNAALVKLSYTNPGAGKDNSKERYRYLQWIADRNAIRETPSAQLEIIKCKDCDWWEKQEASLQGRCGRLGIYPTGEWYCGSARRREDG